MEISDQELLKSVIQNVIREELVNYQHQCILNITPKEAQQLTGHFAGIKAMGNGSITDGFNKMQANHEYWYEQRMFNKSLTNKAKMTIIALLSGGVLFALWEGVKHFIMGTPN